ncbi:circularly permuted type 2 ATP-grasp protein [Halioxenophilus sp. WMMB6]|uniref:circularly permuted type 2 ATP-grasp protein n=1 Tax=Halioxenophilus sp. WMMB6 TaxID=3073815 RepID=UPI00295E9582|nr:circularly permuted type 2 ATP-grasp protein [Halioxenophilus sp. WMMB6]
MSQQQSQPTTVTDSAGEPLRYENSSGNDEALAPDGSLVAPWQQLLSRMEEIGSNGLADRTDKIKRILRDDGAIYNASGGSLVWGLDPLPIILTADQWRELELGLIERAQLLDFILKDLYGNQEIIRRGLVPPEVIYSHPGFIRACHHTHLPGKHQLILYAADLIRSPDGQIMVLGDRTQAPSGSGYALENRLVMQRVFPAQFRESGIRMLRGFFNTLRAQMVRLAPEKNLRNGEGPRVVILTPGAYSETFFEHAFLANYLGYPLVQGKDLTVRKGHVWMKTLDGLSRVDVILRRVDDNYCDPVELRGDSQLGVPGLLEVVRAGNVSVANPLGSGILEAGALMKYLPAISQHFFGKQLRLPSAPTYWCGDPDDLQYVIANLRQLRIKPAQHHFDSHAVYGSSLSEGDLNELSLAIQQNPNNYVAQEYVQPSYGPCWRNNSLQPRPFALRTFAVADDQGYQVMPGGLTRAAANARDQRISNQLGAISKDTWIQLAQGEEDLGAASSTSVLVNRTVDISLPSRVVENLFWVGRYAERSDMTIRLLRTVFMQINGANQLPPEAERQLLYSVTQLTMTYPGFMKAGSDVFKDPEKELLSVILDQERTGSVCSSLRAMLRSASEVREMLSSDTQRVMNDIDDELGQLHIQLRTGMASAPEESLDPLVTALLALGGLFNESMFRGMSWHFLEIGRGIEKIYQLATLMRSLLVVECQQEESNAVCVESILATTEGLTTFRRRFRNDASLYNVLATLMLDRTNPRSLIYQLEQIQRYLTTLPKNAITAPESPREQRALIEAISIVQLADLNQLAAINPTSAVRQQLDQLLVRLQELMEYMAGAISEVYFDHTAGPQQLLQNPWQID